MRKYKLLFLLLIKVIFRYGGKIFHREKLLRGNSHQSSLAFKKWNDVRIKYFILTLLLSVLVLLLVKVGNLTPKATTVSEGIIGTHSVSGLPPVVAQLISSGLVKLDGSGKPMPDLASGWQVNNDATHYTFKLKDNLYWNDGNKIKASDVQFNLPDVEVSYPDEKTIVFKLADSFSPFPALLTAPIFKNGTLTGSGSYKVASLNLTHGVVTKLILVPSKDISLPNLIVRFYPDEKTAKTAFDLGEIESIVGVTESYEKSSGRLVALKKITNYNKIIGIFYNTKDPLMSGETLRKALALAAPKIEGEEQARTYIPSHSWAYNDQLKDTLQDLKSAQGYLNKTASMSGRTITLTTTPSLSGLGERIISEWKKLGLPVVLRVEAGIPQNFQALLISQPIPQDPDQYSLWHSTQTKTNISHYDSKRADKDLEDGRRTADWVKRKENYFDFQKVLQNDTPATFLYFPKTQVLYRKSIEEELNKVLTLQF